MPKTPDEETPQPDMLPSEAWGEIPSHPETLPGIITVQESPQPDKLVADAWRYLDEHPEIRRRIKSMRQDVIAHRTEIMFGVGLASLAAAIGAIVLVAHKRSKEK